MNRVGNYKLTHTLGEGAFAKVKCNVKIIMDKFVNNF